MSRVAGLAAEQPPPGTLATGACKSKGRMSAYLQFSNARRASLVREHPGLQADVVEQGRMLGSLWRDMSDAEKGPFHDAAAKDAERYAEELEDYEQELEDADAAAEVFQLLEMETPRRRCGAQQRLALARAGLGQLSNDVLATVGEVFLLPAAHVAVRFAQREQEERDWDDSETWTVGGGADNRLWGLGTPRKMWFHDHPEMRDGDGARRELGRFEMPSSAVHREQERAVDPAVLPPFDPRRNVDGIRKKLDGFARSWMVCTR